MLSCHSIFFLEGISLRGKNCLNRTYRYAITAIRTGIDANDPHVARFRYSTDRTFTFTRATIYTIIRDFMSHVFLLSIQNGIDLIFKNFISFYDTDFHL